MTRIQFTDDDMNQTRYLEDGQHDVYITSVVEETSKAGKPMIVVEFTSPDGKTCKDWFVLEYKPKLYSLALATGVTPELLKSGSWDTGDLQGKKISLIRTAVGTRPYTARDGTMKEAPKYENSYLRPDDTGFTKDEIPF